MTIIQTIILGIVEGITEFLPISSTAHLEFVSHILGIVQSDFVKSFIIVIQLGAILAVVFIYWKKIFSSWRVIQLMIVGFIPTGIIGFLLYKVIKGTLLGNTLTAAIVLLIGGVIMILVEKHLARQFKSPRIIAGVEQLSYWDMAKLGVIQAIAVVPGVSRSGAVIVGGLLMNIPRVIIIDAAFLLAIPTMAAAAGYDLLKSGISFSGSEWVQLLIGTVVSFVVAYFVVKWLIHFVKTKTFTPFGWYRVIAGIILVIVFLSIK
jgi:undecaprenyl-diphosphatase